MKLHPVHRAKRFFWSLLPASVAPEDDSWIESLLSPLELAAFNRMTVRDRAHSVQVARRVEANLDRIPGIGEADHRWILQAALLHDVGKSDVRLGTYGRVIATLAGWVGGEDMAAAWSQKKGLTRRIGLYLRHPEIGRDILELAGSDRRVSAWAAEHYWEPQRWTIPSAVGELLSAADDGRLQHPGSRGTDP